MVRFWDRGAYEGKLASWTDLSLAASSSMQKRGLSVLSSFLVQDIQERLVFRADAEIEERIRTREVSEDTLAVFFLSS